MAIVMERLKFVVNLKTPIGSIVKRRRHLESVGTKILYETLRTLPQYDPGVTRHNTGFPFLRFLRCARLEP